MTAPAMIAFTVPGRPLAFARAGRHGHSSYTPPEQKAYMAVVATYARMAMSRARLKPFCGPVELTYRATYAYPKTWSQKRRAKTRYRVAAPDSSNLVKLAEDAIQGIVFEDDRQVQLGAVQKVFGSPEGVTITVMSLSDEAEAASAVRRPVGVPQYKTVLDPDFDLEEA